MMDSKNEKKLKKILSLCYEVKNSGLDDEAQYDIIFSPNISKKTFSIFKEENTHFDYYDPDTSYREDMDAFISALDDKLKEICVMDYDDLNNQDIINYLVNKAQKI